MEKCLEFRQKNGKKSVPLYLEEQAGLVGQGIGEVDPELFPLSPKGKGRVALLRGYGNAIVPQVAALFVRATMEAPQ